MHRFGWTGIVLAGALGASGACTAHAAAAGSVEVQVKGGASTKGSMRVALCDRASFLKKCAFNQVAPASTGVVTVKFDHVADGQWAAMAYHDENDNGKLDRNELGIPLEGYGFSRDAKAKGGPPAFDDAAVAVTGSAVVVPVTLRY